MKRMQPKDQTDLFQTYCREHGLRVTPQRIAIYKALCDSGDHPNAEQVHSRVKRRFPTISLNTVNETLLTLSRIGLVDVVEGFGGPRRYDPDVATHHHVHCTNCGKILDFVNESFNHIKPPPQIARGFEITCARVVISGICPDCRKKKESK